MRVKERFEHGKLIMLPKLYFFQAHLPCQMVVSVSEQDQKKLLKIIFVKSFAIQPVQTL